MQINNHLFPLGLNKGSITPKINWGVQNTMVPSAYKPDGIHQPGRRGNFAVGFSTEAKAAGWFQPFIENREFKCGGKRTGRVFVVPGGAKKINLKKPKQNYNNKKNPTTSPSKSTNLLLHLLENKRNFSDLTILVGLSQPRKFCNSRTWDFHFRLSLKSLSPEASSTELIPFFIGILQQIQGFILKKIPGVDTGNANGGHKW